MFHILTRQKMLNDDDKSSGMVLFSSLNWLPAPAAGNASGSWIFPLGSKLQAAVGVLRRAYPQDQAPSTKCRLTSFSRFQSFPCASARSAHAGGSHGVRGQDDSRVVLEGRHLPAHAGGAHRGGAGARLLLRGHAGAEHGQRRHPQAVEPEDVGVPQHLRQPRGQGARAGRRAKP